VKSRVGRVAGFESVLVGQVGYVGGDVRKYGFLKGLAIGESSEIGLYEAPLFGSLLGFGMGMTFASFHL